ncbi:uncharacterized protein MONOS_14881 [Monocercomonoides exilis]|uniref:uncharacterized protein n=1 Tax=Monocercomonoides exilis TaxID=2049356 RepID=UPI00355A730A|nr:hypothetical protein MONOS_14881 [Monocercomonoides exilis]|eukprot:MONOS_14881.1-p1 / transcript=MONOS_14881.1 / gene=MONOS_14881 / organism=Monocercomonoides_exilis_PA203 / gene_product=unspecified product / transcript_product=unspecified product / location=Mono_scaffold01095:17576-18349(+) / protein_length=186 / sequence_SO=supercontig / SO=protein_coding / is_pseudo=false
MKSVHESSNFDTYNHRSLIEDSKAAQQYISRSIEKINRQNDEFLASFPAYSELLVQFKQKRDEFNEIIRFCEIIAPATFQETAKGLISLQIEKIKATQIPDDLRYIQRKRNPKSLFSYVQKPKLIPLLREVELFLSSCRVDYRAATKMHQRLVNDLPSIHHYFSDFGDECDTQTMKKSVDEAVCL